MQQSMKEQAKALRATADKFRQALPTQQIRNLHDAGIVRDKYNAASQELLSALDGHAKTLDSYQDDGDDVPSG